MPVLLGQCWYWKGNTTANGRYMKILSLYRALFARIVTPMGGMSRTNYQNKRENTI